MRTKQIKKLLYALCLGLPMILTAAATAQTETPSVLDRVENVDDSELAELIRVAIENHKDIDQKETLEIIHKVTLSYVQIKLLDQQIAEVSRKITAETGPAEMRYELLMAKTELESKVMTELANLREIMGVIPKHAFEKQPIKTLAARVSLQIIDERVYELVDLEPSHEDWSRRRWQLAGWLSEKETLEHVRTKLKDSNSLPIRFDIYYNTDTKNASDDLRDKIISIARETHSQMDTEVRLKQIDFAGSGTSSFFLRQGKITTFYPRVVKRPDGGPKPLSSGLVNPNDLEQHILWRLLYPGDVPLTFRIEYDQASALLAKLVADTARQVVKRLGITELIGIDSILVEPVPERVFWGRWRGTARADVQTIDVQPNGICQVMMGDRLGRKLNPGAIKAGASVKGTWLLTTKEIIIDINDQSPYGPDFVYRGSLDQESHLILESEQIYPQGNFVKSGLPGTILRKVD
jgi:hypothetical protein